MDLHRSTAIRWTSFTLLIQLVYSASVYPNKNLPSTNNNVEPLCNYQIERYVESEGKESSLTLQLHPGLSNHGTCKRILTAPESHGFIVRLVRPNDIKQQSSGSVAKNSRGITTKAAANSTRSCPLSIFSSSDPLTPSWKIDPCMLEASGDLEEPVKLFQGRLRIVYNHSGNSPNSQLIVTVLGKGVPCQQKNKHPCLRFGYEALLCISKDLVCDGVRHCPKGSEYDSDEDYEMCSKRKMEGLGNDSWEQLTIEIFRNLWNSNLTTNSTSKIGLGPVANSDKKASTPKTTDLDGQVKRNVTRGSIAGDLSRYGPWGYLMLGMLLCGGALLICGLWECCCRQNKSGDTNITASTLPPNITDGEQTNNTAQDSAPPNYDEIDPPPPYSILFPNQKANAAEAGTTSTNNAAADDNNSSEQTSQTSSS